MKTELLEPIEELRDSVSEDQYDEMINGDGDGEVVICGITFDRSRILKELDPIAYNCGYNDIRDTESLFICPICSNGYEDYEEAKFCCQSEEEDDDGKRELIIGVPVKDWKFYDDRTKDNNEGIYREDE
jgi:hypothetical protein